jgi:uncharacterized protein
LDLYLDLTVQQWVVLAAGSVVLGLSRTGIRGASFLVIPVFAALFGGRASSGIVLVLLLLGDLVAITRYRGEVTWKQVRVLLPWAVMGVVLGTVIGGIIPDRVFIRVLAVIILFSAVLMWTRESGFQSSPIRRRFPLGQVPPVLRTVLSRVLGVLAGFTSMIGNAAGPLMTLYFLARGLNKERFVGTAAWFFFFVNLIKVPFHIFVWHTITGHTLILGMVLTPAILAGAFLGMGLTRVLSERYFRWMMLLLVTVASVRLLVL